MPEELLQRLQQLENSYYGDKEAARQKNFFDTYGGRFSNNRGLGLAILNELDAQGIDTSAADEAVTQILDQLRTECNEIIESIKGVQQDAIQNAQKVEAIQNVVSEAVAGNPAADPTMTTEAPMESGIVPEDPTISAMDPNNIPVDDLPDDYAGEPAAEEPAAEEPAAEEPAAEEPAAELPPNEVESDERMKNKQQNKSIGQNIRDSRVARMKSHWSKTHAQKEAEEKKKKNSSNSWKPSEGILDAAKGGR